jgi:hypothetical protein
MGDPKEFTFVVSSAELRRFLNGNRQAHSTAVKPSKTAEVRRDVGRASLAPGLAPGGNRLSEQVWALDWAGLAVGLFFAGAGLAIGWIALGAAQVRRLCRHGVVAPEALQALLRRVAGAAARCPRLLLHSRISQPVALGTIRPTVVLPARAATGVAEAHLEAVLAHEWAHIRRGDLWLLALSRWLMTLLFFHPLYWWLRRRIREDQEALADAAAAKVEGAIDYAATLLHWVRLGKKRRGAAAALALWGKPSELKRRITMLLNPQFPVEPDCPGRWRLGAGGVVALGALALSVLSVRPLPSASAESPAVKPVAKPTAKTASHVAPQTAVQKKIAEPVKAAQTQAVVADFNADGTLDLVVTNNTTPANAAQAKPKAAQEVKAEGSVVDPGKKPVARAEIAIIAPSTAGGPKVLCRTKTDEKGRFQIQVTNPDAATPLVGLVQAKGYGLGWEFIKKGTKAVVHLQTENAIRVRLIDLQGQPAAGIKVHVCRIGNRQAANRNSMLAQTIVLNANTGRMMGPKRKNVDLGPTAVAFVDPPVNLPLWPDTLTADSGGRLTVHGIGRDTGIGLQVRDPRYAVQALDVKPRSKGQSGEVTLILAQARFLEGTVTDTITGKALPGAKLHLPSVNSQYGNQVFFAFSLAGAGEADWKGRKGNGNQFSSLAFFPGGAGGSPDRLPEINVQADKDGRFRISLYQAGAYQLKVSAPAGQPYFDLSRTVSWPKAAARQELKLSLLRGVWVNGKVAETPSGKPVVNARVDFWGPGLKAPQGVTFPSSVQTQADGTFHVLLPPGKWHALVNGATTDYVYHKIGVAQLTENQTIRVSVPHGQPVTYNRNDATKFFYPDGWATLDLKPGAGTHTTTVQLQKAVLKGKLVDPQGKPVTHAVMFCRPPVPVVSTPPNAGAAQRLFVNIGGNFGYMPATDEPHVAPVQIHNGNFELTVNDLEAKYQVFFVDAKNGLGASAELVAKDAGNNPPTVKMNPCGSAKVRLVDDKGKPRVKYQPRLWMLLPPGPHPLHHVGPGRNFAYLFNGTVANFTSSAGVRANNGRTNDRSGQVAFHYDCVWWGHADPAHYAKGPVTDGQGNLVLPTLIAGATFRLDHLNGKFTDFKVESGKALDLKTITVTDPPKPKSPLNTNGKPVRIKVKQP